MSTARKLNHSRTLSVLKNQTMDFFSSSTRPTCFPPLICALTNGGSLMNLNDYPPQLHAIRTNSTFLPVWDLRLTSQMALSSFESPSSLSLMQNHENHHIVRLFHFFFNTSSYLCIFYLPLLFLISLYSLNIKKKATQWSLKCVIAPAFPPWFIQ